MEKQKNRPALRFPEFTSEWESKKLGEIAKFSKGKGIPKIDISADGATECIRYGELYTRYNEVINVVYSKTNIDKKDLILSADNDVIIPASGETQIDIATASCVLRSGIALGGDLNIIKTKNNGVFLSYYLNNRKKLDIASLAQGISVVHLYSSQLALLSLNLPILSEQQKIATFLTAVDNKLNQLKQKKTLLEQYKKGVMQRIFKVSELGFVGLEDDRIGKEGIEREMLKSSNPKNPNSDFLRFKDDDGNEFPEWEVKKLGEIGEFIGGGTPSTQNSDYWIGNIPWVSSSDLSEESIYKINATRFITHEAVSKSATKLVPKGSILIVSRVGVGKVAVNEVDLCTSQDFTNLILNTDNYKFLAYLIKYRTNKLLEFNQGTSIKGFVKSDLENLEVNLPTLAEQTKIANFLSAIDEKIEYCGDQIGKTEQYKKGMLQEMFV